MAEPKRRRQRSPAAPVAKFAPANQVGGALKPYLMAHPRPNSFGGEPERQAGRLEVAGPTHSVEVRCPARQHRQRQALGVNALPRDDSRDGGGGINWAAPVAASRGWSTGRSERGDRNRKRSGDRPASTRVR